jgi:heme-degrading monooxygenase HmoA
MLAAPPYERGGPVFIAMNRFRIAKGSEKVFEDLWRSRESYLDEVPGFREFHLLRGPSDDECTLYASHSVWESRAAFEAWTESESFRKAHQQARAPSGTYLGHPRFEGFEVVL